MIYISSSCVKHKKIKDSIQELVDNGFKNIELSGGTKYYDGFENDLFELKDKYNLNYICHNYFPPPKEHFVLNLASLNDDIYNKTFSHLLCAIELSKKLDAKTFGFHAGFFLDIKVSEIGKKISKENLFNKKKSIHRFCNGYNELKKISDDIKLYVENNVFSSTNAKTYENDNLFMLTNSNEYEELKNIIDFNLLLDIAHLKVSSNTLNLNFKTEFNNLINYSDYIHISDNDAYHDLNNPLKKNSPLIEVLNTNNLKEKTFTLEIYDNIANIKNSYKILEELIND